MRKPIVGLTCEAQVDGLHAYHRVSEKYAASVIDAVGGVPVLIPALTEYGKATGTGSGMDLHALLDGLDGVLLPGGYSNVEPCHYGETSRPGTLHEPQRDALTLALIPLAISKGVPLLAICRGLQEMNVAYGGTLHQHVHEQDAFMDHRENKADSRAVQYGHAHVVSLTPNGVLAQLYGQQQASVNSLHGQGVKQLGAGLQIEAVAPDGLIEAFCDPNAKAFNMAIQWHPEYKVTEDPFYSAIYDGFRAACQQRQQSR
ncbi:MAG: gamma-glutamyl-gamma-aminobutyrate hydrolase family protein [Gammaproteobacteria bacterium]|jgi:putative glutamine amidotransferase|nr:gamma-glutamyl-gamma-aminobutyrate hydrolase family protein [Gammaproteobacteria bacterium]